MVLSLVVENSVGALGGAANIRAEHDVVLGLAVEIRQVRVRTELEVSSTTVNVLFMLDGELDDEVLALV